MKFVKPTTVFALLLELLLIIISLVTCSPAGSPTAAAPAAVLVARATLAPEIPQFPRTAVTCGIDKPHFMRFTKSHYVKSAYSTLFHRNKRKGTFYTLEPKTLARVVCFLHAGIFVENTGDKLVSIPYATIADMARNIVYASCNREQGQPAGRVNGMQADTRDNFVVIVAGSSCRKGHLGTSSLPIEGEGQKNKSADKTGP